MLVEIPQMICIEAKPPGTWLPDGVHQAVLGPWAEIHGEDWRSKVIPCENILLDPPKKLAETVALGTQVRFHPPGKGSSAEKAREEDEKVDDSSGSQASVKTMKGTRKLSMPFGYLPVSICFCSSCVWK